MHIETYQAGVTIDPQRAAADAAFDIAIRQGRLSASRHDANFAGNYMFMGAHNGRDMFKHIMTREYLA